MTKSIDHMTLSSAIHSKTFWVAVVSAILSVITAAGVPLTAQQTSIIEGSIAIIISFVLGGSAVAVAHAKAAASLAQAEQPQAKKE